MVLTHENWVVKFIQYDQYWIIFLKKNRTTKFIDRNEIQSLKKIRRKNNEIPKINH